MDDIDLTSQHPDEAPHPRGPGGHRRLRDGPLLARLPGPVPHRRREDRPELRPRHRARPGEVGHRVGRCGAVAGHRLHHGGGGRGDAGPARGAHEPRVRRRAGLLLRSPALGGRVRQDADQQRRPGARRTCASCAGSEPAEPCDLYCVACRHRRSVAQRPAEHPLAGSARPTRRPTWPRRVRSGRCASSWPRSVSMATTGGSASWRGSCATPAARSSTPACASRPRPSPP